MINMAKVLEADLNSEKGGSPRKRLQPGVYQAAVSKANQYVSEAGSEGLRLEYTVIEGEFAGASIVETIYTKGRIDKGGLDLKHGLSKVKRRLMTFGFTTDDIAKFKHPKSANDLGDYRKLLGKEISITVEDKLQKGGKTAGTTRPEVIRVEALIANED